MTYKQSFQHKAFRTTEEASGRRCSDTRFSPSHSVIHDDVMLADSLARYPYPIYVCEEERLSRRSYECSKRSSSICKQIREIS